jgi:REP element-mobilizing transposase RayT
VTRIRRIETVDRIFFVTFNLIKSTQPLRPAERSILLDVLHQLRFSNNFFLYGYVVMPSHAHFLIHPKSVPLPTIMRLLKSRTTAVLEQRRSSAEPIWQRSYHDFICRRARDFSNKLAYIHENPKAAGLVPHPGQWLWSSYLYYERRAELPVPPDEVGFSGDPDELLWPAPHRHP